jgi:hypothetical protein
MVGSSKPAFAIGQSSNVMEHLFIQLMPMLRVSIFWGKSEDSVANFMCSEVLICQNIRKRHKRPNQQKKLEIMSKTEIFSIHAV